MGLDMYLYTKIGNDDEDTETVGYWRKANQIHGWMVDRVQDGVDDCCEYPVSEDHLDQLEHICKSILKNKKLAEELLPPRAGFFFGGCEYSERYWEQIEETIKIINNLRDSDGRIRDNYYYHSSW